MCPKSHSKMGFEIRRQLMAWLEHGLQMSPKRYALLMEDRMAAGAFGHTMNFINYELSFSFFNQESLFLILPRQALQMVDSTVCDMDVV